MQPAHFAEFVYKQKNRCAICGKLSETSLHIDHDHQTGKVRGLLCGNCNVGLGMFMDNQVFLQNAIDYLKINERNTETTT